MRRFRKWIILLLMISCLKSVLGGVIINEIMADPIGSDSYDEWVELYNNGTGDIDLSMWAIGDEKENDTILLNPGFLNQSMILHPEGYAIITDDFTYSYYKLNYSRTAIKLIVDDSAIGNGLSNSGEALYLYYNATLMMRLNYTSVEEGRSYALVNGLWLETNPTMGYSNNGSIEFTNANISSTNSSTNNSWSNNCDWEITIVLNQTLFNSTDDFSFKYRATKITGEKTNISVVAEIKDVYGNTLELYDSWKNETAATQKTSGLYSPNIKGKSPVDTYFLTANLTAECNDTNLENNFKEKAFSFIKENTLQESSLFLGDVSDLDSNNKAKFGQAIRVDAVIYKGNTTKNTLYLYIKDSNGRKISEETKANIEAKFTNQSLTLPIIINPDCSDKPKNGDYIIFLEGLDKTASKRIAIEGISADSCKIKKVYRGGQKEEKEKSEKPKKNTYEQKKEMKNNTRKLQKKQVNELSNSKQSKNSTKEINKNTTQLTGKTEAFTVYESKSLKTTKAILYTILAFSVMFNIILILRR